MWKVCQLTCGYVEGVPGDWLELYDGLSYQALTRLAEWVQPELCTKGLQTLLDLPPSIPPTSLSHSLHPSPSYSLIPSLFHPSPLPLSIPLSTSLLLLGIPVFYIISAGTAHSQGTRAPWAKNRYSTSGLPKFGLNKWPAYQRLAICYLLFCFSLFSSNFNWGFLRLIKTPDFVCRPPTALRFGTTGTEWVLTRILHRVMRS